MRIAPHERGVTDGIGDPLSGSLRGQTVHDAKPTLRATQRLRAAYLQVQVGVFGVWYEDGSTWPAHWLGDTPPGRAGPFDASLIEAEAGKCTDVATVANALQSVEEIVFGPETHRHPIPTTLRAQSRTFASVAAWRVEGGLPAAMQQRRLLKSDAREIRS